MPCSRFVFGLAALIWATIPVPVAEAAWPNSPFTNLPLCTASGDQGLTTIVSDGTGGAIVTWPDLRGVGFDIYAQHVLASGVVDGAWPANGRALCTASGHQDSPTIVSDGAGGAIVAWLDLRNGNFDIYAHHVLASGVVDPAWPVNGRALCTASGDQEFLKVVSDGAGGAIATWADRRSGASDVYAQHVLASGAVDGAWPVDGRGLCTAPGDQAPSSMISDGAGGAIVGFSDIRSGNYDVYVHHVLASGAVDGAWPADGRALCTATNHQGSPKIVSDGAGGAIATWDDPRTGVYDIYAQHVLASGVVDPAWPVDGRALCTAANGQIIPLIVSDGAGGAVVTWDDSRAGNKDIYAQHVLASGVVDGTWPSDGRALCTASGEQSFPRIASDGAGGAVVIWHDFRSGNYDVFAQHVLASGAVDGTWPADGRALCTASGNQPNPVIDSDDAGGAIVAWPDLRSGSGNSNIYAQRVARYGYLGTPEAEIVSVTDVLNDQGGKVKLSWNASYLESDPYLLVTSYKVFRSVPPNSVDALEQAGARILRASEVDVSGMDSPRDLLATVVAGTTYYWEYLATVNADQLFNYSYLAHTAGENSSTAFMVQARTAGTQHWESLPMSGTSVDNLAPAAPDPFTAVYLSGATHLHWGENAEPDLASYRLYRGDTAGFTPGPANMIATQSDTGYVDVGAAGSYYKLSAVDVHDNESGFALVTPAVTTGVSGGRALAFTLEVVSPNPTSGSRLDIRFALPTSAPARLELLDVAGRRLLAREVGGLGVGGHALELAAGRKLAPGIYWVRLVQGSERLGKKIVVTE